MNRERNAIAGSAKGACPPPFAAARYGTQAARAHCTSPFLMTLGLAAVWLSGLPLPFARAQSVPVGGGGESGIWLLWTRHSAAVSNHAQHAEAFQAFAARRPPDPFAPMAITLQAWHLLQLGRTAEAQALLQPLADQPPADPIARGARELARGWLSLLDRERLAAALERYRVREIRYPERLADLESWPHLGERPPFQDRWGNRWEYQTERLRSMPSLLGQRYSLGSRMLGDTRDFKTALALPYAGRIDLRPVQVRTVPNRQPIIEFVIEGAPAGTSPAMVMVGSAHQDITVAYASASLIVLHDRLHWKLVQTPRSGAR
jgi:hypothetical protein